MITIVEINNKNKKSEIAEKVLRSLPDWFELEQGILDYKISVKNLSFFIAKDGSEIVGFIAIEDINEFVSEIHVMAIMPEYRKKGIGRKMVEFAWDRNLCLGNKYLLVKTLDESAGDKFYEQTRKFYRAVGFLPIMTSTEIWGKDNPCLIMLKER